MTREERQRLLEEAQRHYQFAKEATYAAEATAEAAQSQAASLLVIADCLANGTVDENPPTMENAERINAIFKKPGIYDDKPPKKGKQS